MIYVYNCCFYFSLRLGGIIIGVFSLLQGILMIIALCIGFNNITNISDQINLFGKENDLLFTASVFEAVELDPEKYLILFLTLVSFYTLSCIMLIYGAYACNTYMMYPYLGCELTRIIAFIILHVSAMILLKQNVINLGLLIGMTVFGGFLLLGLFYMWVCVLSLLKLIKHLIREVEIERITIFPKKPAKSDVFVLRNNLTLDHNSNLPPSQSASTLATALPAAATKSGSIHRQTVSPVSAFHDGGLAGSP